MGVEDADDLISDIQQALQIAVPAAVLPSIAIDTPESSRSVNDTPEGSIPATPVDALPALPLAEALKIEQIERITC